MANNDKELIKKRFSDTFRQYHLLAHTQQAICDRLAAMLAEIADQIGTSSGPAMRALEVGTGTGFLTSRLSPIFPGAFWFLNDLAEASQHYVEAYIRDDARAYLWGDAESIEFPHGLGLIATASTVQWFDNLPRFIAKCAGATLPGGYLALTTFGKENFREIQTVAGEGLIYHTLDELKTIITGAGYTIYEAVEYTDILNFPSPTEVLRHIKATGVNGLRQKTWTKAQLADFERRYRQSFSLPGGGVSLTYHPILIIARR